MPSAVQIFGKLFGSSSNSSSSSEEVCDSKGCHGAPTPAGAQYPLDGTESMMSSKGHGSTATAVQADLKWNCSNKVADNICSFNRHYAEHSGYWLTTSFLKEVDRSGPTTFYDSVTGRPLFIAPVGRTFDEFERESRSHGWPSFRDAEVVWDDVRVIPSSGEAISIHGTHLGHNLPDRKGNRYCINLVSIAGKPAPDTKEMA